MAAGHAAVHTFGAVPVRNADKLPLRARSCLSRVQSVVETIAAPTHAERIAFWAHMLEWANENLAELEGSATAHGGDGTSG